MIKKAIVFSFLLLQSVIGFASSAAIPVRSTKTAELRAKKIKEDYFQGNPKIAKFKQPQQPKIAKNPKVKDGGENPQPIPSLVVSTPRSPESDLESERLDRENTDLKNRIEALLVESIIEAQEQALLEKEQALEQEKLKELALLELINKKELERAKEHARRQSLRYSPESAKQGWWDWIKSMLPQKQYGRVVDLDTLPDEN